MKTYQPADIRNVVLVGHATSGKTILSEAMLACAGVINRMGAIASGSTVSDYHEEEQERQFSVHATLMHCEWQGRKFNIVDTPGALDFISEALGALRVADVALVVVHGQQGPGIGTERVWEAATQHGVPKVVAINCLDKEDADFDRTLGQVRKLFGERVFPLAVPINPGPKFNQVLDVLRNTVVTYAPDRSGKFTEAPASGPWAEKAQQLHAQLIEYIAESDDALLEKFFAQGTLSEEELRGGLHAAVLKQTFIPLFAVAGEPNVGVARLMDFLAKYGPCPTDRPVVKARDANGAEVEVKLTDPDPVLFIFKTSVEAQFGELSLFRVYAGTLKLGAELYNPDRRSTEKIGTIYITNGKTRLTVEHLQAGDMGALARLKDTRTGDTLCLASQPVQLPKIEFPRPNIHAAIRLKVKGMEDKVAEGLAALHREDPAFNYTVDAELHQTVISGQGELHLAVIADRLKRRYKVDVELVEPRIPFRETIKAKAEAKYRHKKQTGGAGQFAEVWMRIEPLPRNSGLEFTQSLTGQNVDRVFVPSVEKGVNRAAAEGILAGYRVVDLKVDFYDGKMHPVDSKDIAFQIAGYEAFKEAFMNAKPCLLEPIYAVEVRIPEECMGNVIGDLSSRRGKILGMESDGQMQIVRALVPQMELYRYSSVLRSITGGRGSHKEEFSHYEEMPRELEQKVIEEARRRKAQGEET
jgi:elongation factor G